MQIESGKRYGKLIVQNEFESRQFKTAKYIVWLCHCDCGNDKWIKASDLRANRSQSCGCSRGVNPNWGQKRIARDSKYFYRNWLNIWRRKAEKKEREFNLTLEQLDKLYENQNGRCYYTGDELTLSESSKDCIATSNISIDRIDNDKGYTIDNIVLATKTVNVSRNCETQTEFIAMCKRVAHYHTA